MSQNPYATQSLLVILRWRAKSCHETRMPLEVCSYSSGAAQRLLLFLRFCARFYSDTAVALLCAMPLDDSVVLGTVTIETKTWLYLINESASRDRLKQETVIPMHVGRNAYIFNL